LPDSSSKQARVPIRLDDFKLKRVCEFCNNGWMSNLEEPAKPILLGLKQARQAAERATVLDTSVRLQTRFAFQNLLLQCLQEQRLDALVSPMSTVPPRKLTAPREPNANGRSPIGWSLIGQQGFPAITVPAGFTTEIWDRVRDGNDGTRLVGPIKANLPVGVDFIARPFDEAMLFRIASAFEAATRHRKPPPEFGPVPGEP
jgi:Asp-tRNA(Asn)/Glu-tRNA(Gln) amidotransferase A subunit family amidase